MTKAEKTQDEQGAAAAAASEAAPKEEAAPAEAAAAAPAEKTDQPETETAPATVEAPRVFADIYGAGSQAMMESIGELRSAEARVEDAMTNERKAETALRTSQDTVALATAAVTAQKAKAVESARAQIGLLNGFVTMNEPPDGGASGS